MLFLDFVRKYKLLVTILKDTIFLLRKCVFFLFRRKEKKIEVIFVELYGTKMKISIVNRVYHIRLPRPFLLKIKHPPLSDSAIWQGGSSGGCGTCNSLHSYLAV